MKRVARDELLELGAYEQIREHFRARMVAEKRARYVPLGANMTVLFENHDTVLLQIQEMLRTERITQEAAIQHELATYNELVPAPGELSATVFIEYPDAAERERMMVRLAGIEDKFYLAAAGERAQLVPDTRGTDASRTMAVHYVKFVLPERVASAILHGDSAVFLGVEHPSYFAETELLPATVASLRSDLS
jgi:hypothetical protein